MTNDYRDHTNCPTCRVIKRRPTYDVLLSIAKNLANAPEPRTPDGDLCSLCDGRAVPGWVITHADHCPWVLAVLMAERGEV